MPPPQPDHTPFPPNGRSKLAVAGAEGRAWSFYATPNFQSYGTFMPPNPRPVKYNNVFAVPSNYLGVNVNRPDVPGGREAAVPHYAPPAVPEQFVLRNAPAPRQFLQI
jgi:hypothetical protein